MPYGKKAIAKPPVDEEDVAEGEEPGTEIEPTPPPTKKKKGRMPAPGASTPEWKKIAASMAKK